MKKTTVSETRKSKPPLKKTSVSCEVTTLPDTHCCAILESIGEGVFAIDLNKKITVFSRREEKNPVYSNDGNITISLSQAIRRRCGKDEAQR